jgi:hypothetical protein
MVDRKAVRDALVAQDLLRIHPRRRPRINDAPSLGDDAARALAPCESGPIEIAENAAPIAPEESRADKMKAPSCEAKYKVTVWCVTCKGCVRPRNELPIR